MANNNKNKILNVPNLRFPEFCGEWSVSTIGKEFDLYSGNTPSRLDKEQFKGGINWISSGELKEHYICDTKEKITEEAANSNNLKLLPIGTFVIAIYGLEAEGVRGTCSITQKLSTISQACMAFTSIGNVSNEFLYSWYKKHGNVIGLKYAQGTKQQNLSYDIISQFNILFPQKQEQEKLQRFISLLDERIATQNKIIEDLKKLKSAIYHKLFSNLQGEEYSLLELAEITKGQQINGSELSKNGKYYVMNGGISPSGYYDNYNTDADTISISEGGNSCGYVQYNSSEFWSGGHCYTLRIKPATPILTPFLFHFLKWKEPDIMALRIGSGLPNIQKKDLGKVCIIVPTLNKQQRLIALLSSLQMKIENEEIYAANIDKLKQYLLSQMFI